jgi:3-phenylpropionate/cinnamic acid dioxygenase small subunit
MRAIWLTSLLMSLCSLGAITADAAAHRRLSADDYIEIQQLYANYAQALDKGEGERFAATFVEDGEFTGGRGAGKANDDRTPRKGTAALTKMGSVGGTRHFTANLVITPTADGAKGSCYLLLFNVRNIPGTIVETAIYDDTLVKTAQGWKFKKRVVWRDDDDITPFKPKPLASAP